LELGWRVANCCWRDLAALHFETLRHGDAGTSEIDEQQGGTSAVDQVSLPVRLRGKISRDDPVSSAVFIQQTLRMDISALNRFSYRFLFCCLLSSDFLFVSLGF
jgi:hypothetical protein